MKNINKLIYLAALLIVLVACNENQLPDKKIAPFSFIDQHGNHFGSEDLAGKAWIAQFIFTNCDTVCPQMSSEMAALQTHFEKYNIDIELISFSVDPEVDTSEILKDYIEQYTNNETNWHMLTGYSQEEIEIFAREEFQTIVQKPANSTQVIHGTNFYLVDENGFLVNEYRYIDESFIEEITNDIKEKTVQ